MKILANNPKNWKKQKKKIVIGKIIFHHPVQLTNFC